MALPDALTAASWGPKRLDLFTSGGLLLAPSELAGRAGKTLPGRTVAHLFQDGSDSQWQSETIPAAFDGSDGFVSPLTAASWESGRYDVFGLDADGNLLQLFRHVGSWHGANLGSHFDGGHRFVGGLTAASWGPGRYDVFGLSDGGDVLQVWWDGSSWIWTFLGSGFDSGRTFAGQLTAASWGEGRYDLFGLDADGSLLHLYFDGTWRWQDHGQVRAAGNAAVGSLTAVSSAQGHCDVFGLSKEGRILRFTLENGEVTGSFTGFSYEDGAWEPASSLAAASSAPGRFDLFCVPSNGYLDQTFFDPADRFEPDTWKHRSPGIMQPVPSPLPPPPTTPTHPGKVELRKWVNTDVPDVREWKRLTGFGPNTGGAGRMFLIAFHTPFVRPDGDDITYRFRLVPDTAPPNEPVDGSVVLDSAQLLPRDVPQVSLAAFHTIPSDADLGDTAWRVEWQMTGNGQGYIDGNSYLRAAYADLQGRPPEPGDLDGVVTQRLWDGDVAVPEAWTQVAGNALRPIPIGSHKSWLVGVNTPVRVDSGTGELSLRLRLRVAGATIDVASKTLDLSQAGTYHVALGGFADGSTSDRASSASWVLECQAASRLKCVLPHGGAYTTAQFDA